MFANILMDSSPDMQHYARIPRLDELTIDVLSQEVIEVYLAYDDQLKQMFINFHHENYNLAKRNVNWKEIEDKRLGLSCKSVLVICKQRNIIPNYINVETLNDFLGATIPPLTGDEYEYFNQFQVVKDYETDPVVKGDKRKQIVPNKNEPYLQYHEFLMLVGRMAISNIHHEPANRAKV